MWCFWDIYLLANPLFHMPCEVDLAKSCMMLWTKFDRPSESVACGHAQRKLITLIHELVANIPRPVLEVPLRQ